MKYLLLFSLIFFTTNSYSQKTKKLFFPEVGWTINIPNDSKVFTEKEIDSLTQISNQKVKETIKKSKDPSELTILFLSSTGENNCFSSSVNTFDSATYESPEKCFIVNRNLISNLFDGNKSTIILVDTLTSTEKIAGKLFYKFYAKSKFAKSDVVLYNYWYYTVHDGYDFSINITYDDEALGKEYFRLLKGSSFEK